MISKSNRDFLAALFGAAAPNAHVTSFPDDPNALESLGLRHLWGGNKLKNYRDISHFDRENSYFTISTFRDNPVDGKAQRRKALFEATYVIVVDDVGTKVTDTSKLPPPSYVVETSPGNFQWGYILDMPERDAGRVDALLDGMVALGLCPDGTDPGMKGVTRYVRLPGGRNNKAKYGPGGFQCRLDVFEPSRRYTIEELAQPWGIVLPTAGTVRGAPVLMDVDLDADEVFQGLAALGMISGDKCADGVGFLCTCPWVEGHTGGVDNGTGYWPGGGFKCFHGHCQDKGRKAVSRWVNDKLVAEGREGLKAWAFTKVGAGQGTSGTGTGSTSAVPSVVDEFFSEFIYLGPDDRMMSVRTGELLTRAAADCVWGGRLRAKGALPMDGRHIMQPVDWYLSEDNLGRARIADRLTYWPGKEVFFEDAGVSLANRWHAPESYPLPVSDTEVKPWLDLVRHIVGGEGPAAVESVLDWFALVVAEPGTKPGWHVVVQGGQGLGKDMMAQPMIAGVGRSNVGTVNATSLHSAFNAWAERRLVIVNELKQNSRGAVTGQDQYTTLKELTENTNDQIKINQKNVKEYYARNVGAFYVTSNDEKALALEADDRRFLVVMSSALPLGKGVYEATAEWLKHRHGALMAAEWLRQRHTAMSAARRSALLGNAPGTAGKTAMIVNTEDPVKSFMREQIETGAWPDLMTAGDIASALSAAARGGAGFNWVPSPQRWASILKSLGGERAYGGKPVRLKNGSQQRLWAVRAPDRFATMGEPQLATALASAAGNEFRTVADDKVTPITRAKE